MGSRNTTYDRILNRILNNPILASLITLGVIVIAIVTFTDAVSKLANVFQQLRPTKAVDISGRWRVEATEETPQIYFDFKVVDNKLVGTVLLPASHYMPQGKSAVINGKVVRDIVSFTTKHEFVKRFGHYNPVTGEVMPDVMAESIAHYKGKIKGNEIYFKLQKESGYYAELTAKKIVDLTTSQPPSSERTNSKKTSKYVFMYTLPGHEGGVRSLSFGPDKGRLPSGGLRLASGGTEDGQVKWWDTATAELHGSSYSGSHYLDGEKGAVSVAYRSKTRKGGVDLRMVGVYKKGHMLRFYSSTFWTNTTSGGGRDVDVPGIVGPVAISADLNIAATGETESSGKSTIRLWEPSSANPRRTLTCRGLVRAMALSSDGRVVAVAVSSAADEMAIRLWDTATGEVKWDVSSPPVGTLAFSTDDSLLASGGAEDGKIYIWDAASGSLKLSLPGDPDSGVSCLAFRKTESLMLSAGLSSGVIKLWNIPGGTLYHTLNNDGPVGALAFSWDDRVLASGDAKNGTIKVWAKPNQAQK